MRRIGLIGERVEFGWNLSGNRVEIWIFGYSEGCILWNQKVFVPLRGEMWYTLLYAFLSFINSTQTQ